MAGARMQLHPFGRLSHKGYWKNLITGLSAAKQFNNWNFYFDVLVARFEASQAIIAWACIVSYLTWEFTLCVEGERWAQPCTFISACNNDVSMHEKIPVS